MSNCKKQENREHEIIANDNQEQIQEKIQKNIKQQNQQNLQQNRQIGKGDGDDQDEDENIESSEDCETSQRIKVLVNYLIKHTDQSDHKLVEDKAMFTEGDKDLEQIFDLLLRKFRKLKKTKEEMTKYCMRKAFKFLADKHKKTFECKDSGDFLKQYFQHMESQAFSVPFKKNSEEKTMNTNFLKKVFSSLTFMSDYKQFLKNFVRLVQEDNDKKIKYLASIIKSHLNNGTLKKLQTVKRLPWTQSILDKTIDLANKLITHSPYHQAEGQRQLPLKNQTIPSSSSKVNTNNQTYLNRRRINITIPQLSLSPPKTVQRAFQKAI